MLVIDLIGHHVKRKTDETDCIFNVNYLDNFPGFPTLDMHWSVMIPSIILLGIGPTVLMATVLEFISAQSPHSMKGFLFGNFLCHQRCVSVFRFHCSLYIQFSKDMGKFTNEGTPSSCQLSLSLAYFLKCSCTGWPLFFS